jgi:hypothetical protein
MPYPYKARSARKHEKRKPTVPTFFYPSTSPIPPNPAAGTRLPRRRHQTPPPPTLDSPLHRRTGLRVAAVTDLSLAADWEIHQAASGPLWPRRVSPATSLNAPHPSSVSLGAGHPRLLPARRPSRASTTSPAPESYLPGTPIDAARVPQAPPPRTSQHRPPGQTHRHRLDSPSAIVPCPLHLPMVLHSGSSRANTVPC